MSQFMTVNAAFEKATELQTLQVEQLGILQAQAKYARGATQKAATNVGLEVGTQVLGGRKVKVENTDLKGFKKDLRNLFLWGPVKTELKRQGGLVEVRCVFLGRWRGWVYARKSDRGKMSSRRCGIRHRNFCR